MKYNKNIGAFLKETAASLGFALPPALAVGACTDFGAAGGIMTAVVSLLFSRRISFPGFLLIYLSFTAVAFTGTFGAALSGLVAGVIVIFSEKLLKKYGGIKIPDSVAGGLMLGTAFSLTALFTTHYFGIGASGRTVIEIIGDYVSRGFHANWRGVLYGTITMVIMITFPRAFKKTGKWLNAALLSLIVTSFMTYLLNPSYMPTAINEIGAYSPSDIFRFPAFEGFRASFLPFCFINAVAIALVIISAMRSSESRSCNSAGAGNIISSVFGGVAFAPGKDTPECGFPARITAIAVIIILYFCGMAERIPIHSLAVVIIVGAWQWVDWHRIATGFREKKYGIILFIVSAASVSLVWPSAVITAIFIAALIINRKKQTS